MLRHVFKGATLAPKRRQGYSLSGEVAKLLQTWLKEELPMVCLGYQATME